MTLPDERYRAVVQAAQLLADLCNTKATPRIPQRIRDRARSVLRHYPSGWDLARVSEQCPDIFVERLDPLYKMIKQHDMEQRVAEEVSEDLRDARRQGLI
jgi:hypothetical protein